MIEMFTPIQFVNVFLCFILAVHLLSASARRPLPARLLGGNYLLFATQSILLIVILNDLWSWAANIRPCLAMMIAPLYYLYAQSVFRLKAKLLLYDYLHFLPMIVVSILIMMNSPLCIYIDWYILTSYSLYLILVLMKLFKGTTVLEHLGVYARPAFRWLWVLSLLAIINIIIEISVYFELQQYLEYQQTVKISDSVSLFVGLIIYALVNMVTMLVALRRIELVEWMYEFSERTLSNGNIDVISDDANKVLFQRWQIIAEQKKLYLREFGITLTEAAKIMSVPTRHLSNAVNQVYGASFSQYLNDRRVDKVKELIKENPEMSLTTLMLEAGFNTKSNFNKEFSRFVGLTPSQYRKTLAK